MLRYYFLSYKKGILKYIFVISLLIAWSNLHGQEMLGIANSKYNAVHANILNPAFPVLSPYYLDVNILTAHAFIENNYIYIKKQEDKLSKLIQGDFLPPNYKYYYDDYTPSLKYGYINMRLLGPSFSLITGKNAFGLSVSLRSATSLSHLPQQVAKFFYEGLYFPPQYDIRYDKSEEMSFASLQWGEIGLSYSIILMNRGLDIWSAGITLKILPAYAGAYALSDHIDFEVPNYDTLIIYDADVEAGFSLPLNYDNAMFDNSEKLKGFGAGMDLGLIYAKKKVVGKNNSHVRRLCSQHYHPYHWRVGLSLLDVGKIRFNKNARKLAVNNGNLFWPGINSTDYSSINEIVENVSTRFFNDSEQLIVDDEFQIGLPTALSIQGDYNLIGNWFISGVGLLPIKLLKSSVSRISLLSGGVRYETPLFQLGMLVNLEGKRHLNIGLNGRLGNFFIGTENILSFLKVDDFTGTDIYAGIKINFLKGKCRNSLRFECNQDDISKFKR